MGKWVNKEEEEKEEDYYPLMMEISEKGGIGCIYLFIYRPVGG